MQGFKNILLVSRGLNGEETSFTQALSLVKANNAKLTIQVEYPELPQSFDSYRSGYEQGLKNNIEKMLETACDSLDMSLSSIKKNLNIHLDSDDKHAVKIIQAVLKSDYDLVIKQANSEDSKEGLKSLDMELLRKCPAPVWITRQVPSIKNILVAIDPESPDDTKESLARNLIQVADLLAKQQHAKLTIMSCWLYAFEEAVKENDFIDVSDEELKNLIESARSLHYSSFEKIVNSISIASKYELEHIKGTPNKAIPKFIQQNRVDLLIMGTIGRSGISRFLMGNTAEDVFQTVTCSVLALKPKGFVSSIKQP